MPRDSEVLIRLLARALHYAIPALCLFGALVNFTQPFWVDDTPVYPPALGVVIFGPLCLFGFFCWWMDR